MKHLEVIAKIELNILTTIDNSKVLPYVSDRTSIDTDHPCVALGITNDDKCRSNAGDDNGGKVRQSHRLSQREHLLLYIQCGNMKGESTNHRRRANLLAIPKQRTRPTRGEANLSMNKLSDAP
jgi:hypothetical protein